MAIFPFFKDDNKSSASVARERLKVIVAHERLQREQPEYFQAMQRDIMEVIKRYVDIDPEDIQIQLENEDNCSVLELNVTLPN